MNVHHLELFYYVAKYQGITQAVRKMPYGIQQPAVSGQILQLEKNLGLRLFHRRPFALTAAGEELYAFSKPFFSQLDQIAGRLRGHPASRRQSVLRRQRGLCDSTARAADPGHRPPLRRKPCPALRGG